MTLSSGTILNNRYRIIKLLGQGGMGAVYRAWDLNLELPVAIKENLDPETQVIAQFKREAQMLATLKHAHLARVSDYFAVGLVYYLVMDFIDGEDLQSMVQREGALPEAQVLDWILQVADALVYLHSQTPPVIHRDIKPANIRITPSGQAYLVDFGIAKYYDPLTGTTHGARAVTPPFSPMEQYGTGRTDARSDVYALGATMYVLLTGHEPPESVERANGVVMPAPRIWVPQITSNTEIAVLRAMELVQAQRYQKMTEFIQALKPILVSQAVPAQPAAIAPHLGPNPPQPVPVPQLPYKLVPNPTVPPIHRDIPWKGIGIGSGVLVLLMFILLGRNLIAPPHATPTPAPMATATEVPLTATSASASTPSPILGSTQISSSDDMVQVYVPSGYFLMGSLANDSQAYTRERPPHTVNLDAFWIDQTEVTNGMYAKCVAAGTCQPPSDSISYTRSSYYVNLDYADYPVIYVNWSQAEAYCTWAGRRLPMEAEWEKAARGTDGRIYPWGNAEPTCSLTNFNNCKGDTTSAGSYPSDLSPYGALDMGGNVLEWVADWYDENYYKNSPLSNPQGPLTGTSRVFRGGSWTVGSRDVRSAVRNTVIPDIQYVNLGFRCAR